MGKLIAFEWMGLNGVFDADTMNEWWFPYDNGDRQQCIQDVYLHTDAFVMGRVTCEILAPHWSQLADDEQGGVAGKLNHAQKYVVSSRPLATPWQNSVVISGHGEDVNAAVEKVKDEQAETLIIGSGMLMTSLMQASLIEEYKFLVNPIIAGHGKRLFADNVPTGLQLIRTRELDQARSSYTTSGATLASRRTSYWLGRSGDGPLSVRGCPSTVKGHPKILSKTASQKAPSGPAP